MMRQYLRPQFWRRALLSRAVLSRAVLSQATRPQRAIPRGTAAALLSIGLVSLASVAVQAQTATPETATPEADTSDAIPTPEASTPPTVDLTSYTYGDVFAVGLPSGWQATEQADSPQLILTNGGGDTPAADTARIEITWHEQPPEVVVAQLLNDLKTNGYRVSRYEPEGIDNTTALNVWLTDLPNDLPNAFMSYIGYADTTAAVVSYYTAPNPPWSRCW